MKSSKSTPRSRIALSRYTAVSLLYMILVILLPANRVAQHNYGLSSLTYHVILLLLVIPLLCILAAAFYSYSQLQQYSNAVDGAPEADGFKNITSGFKYLAWGLALTSILSLVLNAIADRHTGFHASSLVITNYASLMVPLLGFSFINTGARSINMLSRITVTSRGLRRLAFVFILFGALYCLVTFRRLNLQSLGDSTNPYYLPTWLMLVSVVVPYLYAWFIGLVSAYEMHLYSKHISGVLYKQAMRLLSAGVVATIVGSILMEYIRIATPRTGHLSLNRTLVLVNITYVVLGFGYILISFGARKLHKIEEV